MPTFYTANIENGTDLTLRGYALRAARGMMALVTMRDAPNDAPIPRQLEPDTAYYDKQLAGAKARIAELAAMTPMQRAAAADIANWAALDRIFESRIARKVKLANYTQIRTDVLAWQNPPEGLKEFMLDQIGTSTEHDCADLTAYMPKGDETTDDWYRREFEDAARTADRAEAKIAEIVKLTAGRNAWLAQLWASLPEANA